jgi:iron-sulfur cluster assembly protein
MLTITHEAGVAITSLTAQQGVGGGGGLRIHTEDQTDQFGRQAMALSVAALAEPDDQVVTEDSTGAQVFLDQSAAAFLDDKMLDAGPTPAGETQFTITRPTRSPAGPAHARRDDHRIAQSPEVRRGQRAGPDRPR